MDIIRPLKESDHQDILSRKMEVFGVRLIIYLKNKEILEFLEQSKNAEKIDDEYKRAMSNRRLMILKCTNGDFMINPHEISYIFVTSDNPLGDQY